MIKDWSAKHVLILGAARQGLAAARWFARHGALVTLNDRRSPGQMSATRSLLAEPSVTWVLGAHPIELLDTTEIVCLSGGIPLDNPLVVEAQKRGLPLTNDTQVFMEVVPCKTIGITGSAGKTTTTTLVGQMAQQSASASPMVNRPGSVFIGGNLGDPLLNHVDEMSEADLAILEISSFQLEQMTISPSIAAVLNITPNHLDRHGTMEAYTAAKERILEFQSAGDTAVLGREDTGSWNLRKKVRGQLVSFGFGKLPEGQDGTFLADGILHLRERSVDMALLRRDQVHLRGDHNLLNILAAFAIGEAAGFPLHDMLEAADDFRGVAHRLEFVRQWNGAQWYNDSIATAPERTMAAVRSFTEPIVLLLGGRDKNLPWETLAALCAERVDHVVLFGEAAEKIAGVFAAQKKGLRPETLERCEDLEAAVRSAAKIAASGDVVLLSPGGTSFDQFRDFEERGEAFQKWVSELS